MTARTLHILIADDNISDRLILQSILQREGHTVVAAEDGEQAVQLFAEHHPDIVLLDALMPVLDGYAAAEQIKRIAGEKLVPIIFLTSQRDSDALARCLDVGGDDFLTKPYNRIILRAKVTAFARLRALYDTLAQQRDAIRYHTDRLEREQEMAKKIFDNIAHPGCLDASAIRYQRSPMYVFNGDVLLAAEKPSGGLLVLLGDFTGHGLPAAIGAMPVSEVFYGMARKGFALADIVGEMNARLKEILPTGVFCCAVAAEIDYRQNVLHVWNGGMPEGLLIRHGQGIVGRCTSRNLPLGVVGPERFRAEIETLPFLDHDRLFMTSDGLIEMRNPAGEMFGDVRLEQVISAQSQSESVFPAIQSAVEHFRGGPDDDLTFVEVNLVGGSEEPAGPDPEARWGGPQDWSFQYELRPASLRAFDPLPLVLQMLMESPDLRPHRGRVFTILSEMYSNALDHGVLGLDSALKNTPEGFAEYYRLRRQRLDQLSSGYVRIALEQELSANGGRLSIRLEDSGPGFDWQALRPAALDAYSGRGIALLRRLCTSVEFAERGNVVQAVYDWTHEI